MSSFLVQSQIDSLTGIFSSHYDTFSSGSNNFISVIKQPIKQINNTYSNVLPGYGSTNMNVQDITYQYVTGVFPAMIIYPHTLATNQFAQLKFNLDENSLLIKVKQDCKDYILTDKTLRILVDGQEYNPELGFAVQSYFGSRYYYFRLTITK